MSGDKHTVAVPVVPPANGPKARPRGRSSGPQRTIAAAIVPPVAPKRASKPPVQSSQATVAAPVIPASRRKGRPSQQNTIAAPVIAEAPAGPPADYQPVNKTVVATAVKAEESCVDVAIDPNELLDTGMRPPHRIRRPAPTFENLTVVAPPSRVWLYATSAAVVLLAVLLLVVP